jgi:lysophospholipase L1-like esterase
MISHSSIPQTAKRSEFAKRTLLLLLSLALSLICAEILVRVVVTVRDVGPAFTTYDSVSGKRLKRAFRGTRVTPEFTMTLTTNSLGFRGPEPNGAISDSILFLGDSFTLGYGVNDGEEFPARVAAALRERHGDRALPVVNAGIGDSGNGFWLRFLRSEAEATHPRLVVMQFLDNDLGDNVSERLYALTTEGTLAELPTPPPGLMRRVQGVIEATPGLSSSYLVGLVRQFQLPGAASSAVAEPTQPSRDFALRLTTAIVEAALEACRERGWPVLGVLVGLDEDQGAAMRDALSRYGAYAIELPSKVDAPDLYYRVDGHWNAAGHADAARGVLEALDVLQIGTK